MMNSQPSRWPLVVILACVVAMALSSLAANAADPIKIGVLAFRSKSQTLAQWQPLVIVLKQAMPEKDFTIDAFTLPELDAAVASRQLDFVFTNPAHYIKLNRQSGLSAPLATVIMAERGLPISVFGGVIFSLANRDSIQTLADIKGKNIAAIGEDSLGGYQMQAYIFNQASIYLPLEAKVMFTGEPHDNVVQAVLTGRADVGFVRTGVLESLAREGQLDITKIKVINQQNLPHFPVRASTRLYPEWPLAAMSHVNEDVSRHVAAALFLLEENSKATAVMGIHGFTVPADYTPVTDLLRALRAPPFESAPTFTLYDVWLRYQWQMIIGFMAIALIMLLSFRLQSTRRRLQLEHGAMQESEANLKAVFDAMPDALFELDLDGRYHAVKSPKDSLLAVPQKALIGRTVQDVLSQQSATIVMAALQEANATGHSQGRQLELLVPLGLRWFELSVAKKTIDGQLPRFIVLSRDITERKRAEAYEQFRTRILELLVAGEPLRKLLESVVLGVEALNPKMLCSILLLDAEGKRLGDAIAPSLPDFYNRAINGVEVGLGVGSCGTAAFTGETVIVEDVATHPYWVAYRPLANRAGLQACWSQPIFASTGRVLGTFAIYHREKAAPTPADLALIEQGAQLVSIAIERKQAENNIQIAATTFDSQESLMVTDVNRMILRVNQSFSNITGYSAEEVIGQPSSMFRSGRQDEDFYKVMWDNINRNGGWQGEVLNRRKNGEIYPGFLSISAVKNEQGLVTNYVSTLSDITESKAAADEIQSLAFYDPLTGLPNRRLLLDRLNQALVVSARSSKGGALLFLDLDHFKTLNDTLGHDIGDKLLQEVANRLLTCVREGDTVARLGGDEFVVMLEDLSEQSIEAATQVEHIGHKILTALNQPYQLDIHEHHSTPSIGIALFSDHGETQEELLKHADIAMYQAKKAGRNTLRFFDPQMQETINNRANLEGELRKALERKQFQLYYQIQVDDNGHALGAEVLIRWCHPKRGLI
ncbi:MAG: diguanylate cyclase, partial [Methylotenera sp.]|nr:diguanylate cyclase [Methylotenera sp.]